MKITVNLEQLHQLKPDLYNQIKRHVNGRSYGTETIDVGVAFVEAIKRFQEANPIELWEAEQAAEKRAEDKRQEAKDEAEATERLKFWFSCGLIANEFNKNMLDKILTANNARFHAANVDLCMNQLRDKFQWKQAEVPEPPPLPPPPPELIPGTNEVRLPLGTVASTRHTVTQLRDLDARDRAERARLIREGNNTLAAAAKAEPALEVL